MLKEVLREGGSPGSNKSFRNAGGNSRSIEKCLFWFTGKEGDREGNVRMGAYSVRGCQPQGGFSGVTMGATSPVTAGQLWHLLQPTLLLWLPLSCSSPLVIQTLMKCVLEAAFCCFILIFLHFLSLCVQGKSLLQCNLTAMAAGAWKKKYVCVYGVELAKKWDWLALEISFHSWRYLLIYQILEISSRVFQEKSASRASYFCISCVSCKHAM